MLFSGCLVPQIPVEITVIQNNQVRAVYVLLEVNYLSALRFYAKKKWRSVILVRKLRLLVNYNTTIAGNGASARTIAGVVGGGVALLLSILFYIMFYWQRKAKKTALLPSFEDSTQLATTPSMHKVALSTRQAGYKSIEFSYEELFNATKGFRLSNIIGQGGFGAVYYAKLRGQKAAIKKMDMQATNEFLAELKVLTHVHHLNLVRLIGYCIENSLFLVYEYIENGNLRQHLSQHLHSRSPGYDIHVYIGSEPLSWAARIQIALDSARGLEYIHEHTVPVCIHRDIKSANVLIDKNYRAKVADFGLEKLTKVDGTSLPTRGIVGTFGYMPPEYARYGDVSPKVDVYAFGVVLYELISAKEAIVRSTEPGSHSKGLVYLFEEALDRSDPKEGLQNLIDPALGEECPIDSILSMAVLARACTQEDPKLRPTMRSVVVTLMSLSSTSEFWDMNSIQENQDVSFHAPEDSGTSDISDDHLSQSPNGRAKVSEHFEQNLTMVEGVPRLMVTGTKIPGTNSPQNQFADSCPKIIDGDRNRFISTMKKQPSESSFKFDPQRTRELMVKWCIHAEVALNKFDDPYFAPWMESMQPTFSSVGRQTMHDDCVSWYELMKQELRSELQNLDSRICFTSDLWTSNQKLGYICLTAHYVDAHFVLKKKIVGFRDVKYPHTGLAIEEAITKCLTEWGIGSKIFTITLDNALNNKSACDLLQQNGNVDMLFGGEHLHVRCCAHIMNILLQDGIGVAHEAIEIIRELIRHVDSSPGRIQAFNEISQRSGLPSKAGLVLDVPNNWNSTHSMIIEAVKYKVVLKQYAEAELEPSPTEPDWVKVEAIGEFIGAFLQETKAFSACRTPTSQLFLHNVLCIHQILRNRDWQINQVLKDLASAMDSKFNKYWDGNYNMALVIATILDPSKKIDFLDFFYEKVCGHFVNTDTIVTLAKDWLTKYFEEYEKLLRRKNASSACFSAVGSTSDSPVLGKIRVEEEFVQWSQRRGRRIPKSELDAYLEEELVRTDESFEILSWWKTNANKYPVVSAMARDFLAIPLSTISSEIVFSSGCQILGDNISSITQETLETLICGKDWLYEFPNNEGQHDQDQNHRG